MNEPSDWRDIFRFWFRYSCGEFNFHVGFFWVALIAVLIWWAA